MSSSLHKHGVIDFETLSSPEKSKELLKHRKHRNPLYSDSKLCNFLHGQELKRRLAGVYSLLYLIIIIIVISYSQKQFSFVLFVFGVVL